MLHFTAAAGFDEGTAELLRRGAQINVQQPVVGATPIYFAAMAGHVSSVGQLIDAKADLNIADKHGVSPLMQAARHGWVSVVRRLLDAGALTEQQDSSGQTVFAHARVNSRRTVSNLLAGALRKQRSSRRAHAASCDEGSRGQTQQSCRSSSKQRSV